MSGEQVIALWKILASGELYTAWTFLSQHHDVDVNAINEDLEGQTPLHWSCEKDDVALVMLLYMKGANVNAVDYLGRTPLHIAATKGNYQLVAFLIKAGADATASDDKGKTPRFYASGTKSKSCGELLSLAELDPARAKVLAAVPIKETKAGKEHRATLERVEKNSKKIAKLEEELAKVEDKRQRTTDSKLLVKLGDKSEALMQAISALRNSGQESDDDAEEGKLQSSPSSKRRSWLNLFKM